MTARRPIARPFGRPLALAVSALLTLAVVADAQTTRPAPPPSAETGLAGLDRLQQRIAALDLTPDQKQQVQALKDSIAERVKEMVPQLKDASTAERRELMKTEFADVREKFMAILTPAQKAKLREAGPIGRGAGAGGRPALADLKPGKAKAAATTQAATTQAAAVEGPMIVRLRQTLATLGLSDEQKTQTDAILADASTQAAAIRQNAAGDRNAARDKALDLGQSVRGKINAVLTPEQRTKMAESLPAAGGAAGGARRRGPATRPGRGAANVTVTPGADVATAASASSAASSQPALVAGEPAPAFALKRLNGTDVTNRTFAGRPVVLVFGSLTSPSFRDRLPRLLDLKNKVRSRASVAVVYTREAHPSDGWQVERNRDDKIVYAQPTTAAERLALAGKLKEQFGQDLDVLVDGMDDAMLAAFGGLSDGAVVIGPYGKLAGTQKYCDPSGLPRLIDLALKDRN